MLWLTSLVIDDLDIMRLMNLFSLSPKCIRSVLLLPFVQFTELFFHLLFYVVYEVCNWYELLQVIRNHPSAIEIYKKQLLETGQVTKEVIDRMQNKVNSILNEEFKASKDYVPQKRDWLSNYWSGFKSPEQLSRIRNTG